VGAFGSSTAEPMGGVMMAVAVVAGLLLALVVRRDPGVQTFGQPVLAAA
jgi:hypothetical protein